ncbi:hypothetical protein F383_01637 [Gossypium arboreum]|uniref:Uncharacterized protein n=1 Tax=Gossypium arboreum TaxID=29729 RepID=A0A0B0PJR7_GOSAR|nr:hypothetical protein F383_01637 [Gossypium arboreum]
MVVRRIQIMKHFPVIIMPCSHVNGVVELQGTKEGTEAKLTLGERMHHQKHD